jgi:predicted nucleic acid-binding protein
LIVDTGPLVAAANQQDPDGDACRKLLRDARDVLVVPALVVAEAGYLIERELGARAEATFVRALASSRFRVEAPTPTDLTRSAELVERYADFPLGVTDASLVALAERLGDVEVATLDHRHFTVVQPRHVEVFTLLP